MATSSDALSALLLPHADGVAAQLLCGSGASSSSSYLSSLTTQSLSTLTASPAALNATLSALDGQLSALCLRQVGAMSSLHSASRRLQHGTASLEERSSALLDLALPALEAATASFAEQSAAAVQERRAAQALGAQRTTLEPLLSTPALLEACVKARLADEALALAQHVAKLASSPEWGASATLRSIEAQCVVPLRQLRSQLLAALEAPSLRGAAARRAVRHLRALRSLDREGVGAPLSLPEDQLALSLLRARTRVLNAALEAASPEADSASAQGMRVYLSAWREHVLETLALYAQLFQEAQHFCLLSAFLSRAQQKLLARLEPLPSAARQAKDASAFASDLAALHTQLSYTSANLAKHGSLLHPRAVHLLAEASQVLFLTVLPRSVEAPNLSLVQSAAILARQIDVPSSPIHAAVLPALTSLRVFAPLAKHAQLTSALEARLQQYLISLLASAQEVTSAVPGSAPMLKVDGVAHSLDLQAAHEREERATKATLAALLRADVAAVRWARRALHTSVFAADEATLPPAQEALQEALGQVEQWAHAQEQDWRDAETTLEESIRRTRSEEKDRLEREAVESRRLQEERRKREEEERIREEHERLAKEEQEARIAEEHRIALKAQEEQRKAEAERLAEQQRLAEQARLAQEAEEARRADVERATKAEEEAVAFAAAAKEADEARIRKEREDKKEAERIEAQAAAAAAAAVAEEAQVVAAAMAETEKRRATAEVERKEREEAEQRAAAEEEMERKAAEDEAAQPAGVQVEAETEATQQAKAQLGVNQGAAAAAETAEQEAQRVKDEAVAAAAAQQQLAEEEEEAAAEAERARKRAERASARQAEEVAAAPAAAEKSQLESQEGLSTPRKLTLAEKLQLKKEERERKDRESAAALIAASAPAVKEGTEDSLTAVAPEDQTNGANSDSAPAPASAISSVAIAAEPEDSTNGNATPLDQSANVSATTSAAPSEAGDEAQEEATVTHEGEAGEGGKPKAKKKKKRKGKVGVGKSDGAAAA